MQFFQTIRGEIHLEGSGMGFKVYQFLQKISQVYVTI
jgi:hypothetical protein